MKTSACVYIRTTFVGFHRWVNAPDEVAFLRDYHRHVFHVKVGVHVSHNDRDVEFFALKKEVDWYLTHKWNNTQFDQSCEMIAMSILGHLKHVGFNPFFCDVSEDNENGSVVYVESEAVPVREYLSEDK